MQGREQEVETAQPTGTSNVAKGFGCLGVLVLLAGSATVATVPTSSAELIGYLIGVAAIPVVIIYFTWLRGSSAIRVIGGIVAVFVIFAFVHLARIGGELQKVSKDAAILSAMKSDENGRLALPSDGQISEPATKVMMSIARETQAVSDEFDARLEKLGAFGLLAPDTLTKNPSILKNCEDLTTMQKEIPKYRARQLAIMQSVEERLNAVNSSPEFKREILKGYRSSLPRGLATMETNWTLNSDQLSNFREACELLAERNWEKSGENFAFRADADARKYNQIIVNVQEVGAKGQKLVDDLVSDRQASLNKLK